MTNNKRLETSTAKTFSRESTRSPSPPRRRESLPLAPSLKKTRSSLAQKWSAYMDALGQQHAQQPHGKCCRHVRFRDVGQEYERPTTTADEKASYHYSPEELGQMMHLGKHLALCASRFDGLPADTIVEQGYLTLPAAHSVFFHTKRYYCLLQRNELRCYASPVHAAKRKSLKARFTIIQVQDCAKLSMQRKIALFGAHLPAELALMLLVTKASGECVTLTTESKLAKRNWLHTLRKLTEVVEFIAADDDDSPTGSPADKRQRADSPPHVAADAFTDSTLSISA